MWKNGWVPQKFTPLAGDRYYSEDAAITGGLGKFRGRSVVVMGHEKGHDTESRIRHNFGMARPEGYRKAVRLMDLADKFGLPLITLIDTAGAYPGVGAEERGQAEAIARSTDRCLSLGVPMVSVVIGEGGSGGAIAIATANRILMLEHAIYSVISPEGCAAILWKDSSRAEEAAAGLQLTSDKLLALGLVDRVVPEPVGGAHTAHRQTAQILNKYLVEALERSERLTGDERVELRYQKFRRMGDLGLSTVESS